jgi:quinol monooxygenase YgiN
MGQRIAVVARMKAKEGAVGELRELLLALIAPSRADEGCITYELHQAIDDSAVFVFYEIWESKDLLDRHLSTPHLQQFLSKVKDLLAGPPEITLFSKIS